jgi:hypothetical protein
VGKKLKKLMGFYQEIMSMFILGASTLFTVAILHTRGKNLGPKVSLSFGKNLMGFYQEIISTFIL